MLVFGVDVPLVEVVITLSIIVFIILIEAIIVIGILIKQSNKSRQLTDLIEKLSETILEIKKAELNQLDKQRSRK